jgi:hypothetical protein
MEREDAEEPSASRKEVMKMGATEHESIILQLILRDALALQRYARQYRLGKLSREHFISDVEEIGAKIEQRLRPTDEEDIPF